MVASQFDAPPIGGARGGRTIMRTKYSNSSRNQCTFPQLVPLVGPIRAAALLAAATSANCASSRRRPSRDMPQCGGPFSEWRSLALAADERESVSLRRTFITVRVARKRSVPLGAELVFVVGLEREWRAQERWISASCAAQCLCERPVPSRGRATRSRLARRTEGNGNSANKGDSSSSGGEQQQQRQQQGG